ncbi:Uncharacterized protein FWK35_00025263 [Aphis craccivora]|uniref:Uncharacterized protein n=1 Tax=Aphis craccivora TaxID=307492 RepID=A0A6G0Y8B4_APHCR|nr:Uncharacterized protein FWK35_00025263 [Aphis craccivora]
MSTYYKLILIPNLYEKKCAFTYAVNQKIDSTEILSFIDFKVVFTYVVMSVAHIYFVYLPKFNTNYLENQPINYDDAYETLRTFGTYILQTLSSVNIKYQDNLQPNQTVTQKKKMNRQEKTRISTPSNTFHSWPAVKTKYFNVLIHYFDNEYDKVSSYFSKPLVQTQVHKFILLNNK